MTDRLQGKEALPAQGTPREVFATFLKLGLTSFGGPIAHLGYFRLLFSVCFLSCQKSLAPTERLTKNYLFLLSARFTVKSS